MPNFTKDQVRRILSGGGAALSPLLRAAMTAIKEGDPSVITTLGDSTGNGNDEWVYLLGLRLAARYGLHTVGYRVWDHDTQEYGPVTYLSQGSLGRRYILAGQASTANRIEIASNAQVSTTGDLWVEFDWNMAGAYPNAAFAALSKFGAAGNRSWRLEVTPTGQIFFEHSADGTALINRTTGATLLTGSYNTSLIRVAASLDVDNGAGGNTVTFYISTDGGLTYTQFGTPDVKAGTTTVFASTAPVQFIGRGSSPIANLGANFQFYGARAYSSLNRTGKIFDIDVGAIPAVGSSTTSIAFTDDAGNTATLITGAGAITGSPRLMINNASTSGMGAAYSSDNTRHPKQTPGDARIVFVSYGHNEAANVDYTPAYGALTDKIAARHPRAAIVCIEQNPRVAPASNILEHGIRNGQIAAHAASKGYTDLDIYSEWLNKTDGLILPDGFHPAAAGSEKWAARVDELLLTAAS